MSNSTNARWMGNADGEHRIASVRAQTAIVRTLADALKRHEASGEVAAADSLRAQLIEELSRLGLSVYEGAGSGR
jgi:hypothetical protein